MALLRVGGARPRVINVDGHAAYLQFAPELGASGFRQLDNGAGGYSPIQGFFDVDAATKISINSGSAFR